VMIHNTVSLLLI